MAVVGFEEHIQTARNAGAASTIVVKGEAGSGKTTCLEEICTGPDQGNVIKFRSTGQADELAKWMLKGRAEELYEGWNGYHLIMYVDNNDLVVHAAGPGVAEAEKTGQDTEVLGSMAKAVRAFVKDALSQGAGVKETSQGKITHEDGEVHYHERGGGTVIAVVKGPKDEKMLEGISKDLSYLAQKFPETGFDPLKWTGDLRDVPAAAKSLVNQFSEKQYLLKQAGEPSEEKKFRLYDLALESIPENTTLAVDGVENLHGSDLELLGYIARAGPAKNIRVMFTYNPKQLKEEHKKFLESLEEPVAIELSPLTDSDLEKITQSYFPDSIDEESFKPFLEWLQRESKGKPRYVHALVESILEEGKAKGYFGVQQDGKVHAFKSLTNALTSKNLDGVTAELFETLTEQEQYALKHLATVGQVESGVLTEALGKDWQADWDKVIDHLTKRGRIEEVNGHIKVKDNLIAEKAKTYATRRTHLALGEALETFVGQTRADQIAEHYSKARDPRAAEYGEIAGDASINAGSALTGYDVALQFAKTPEDRLRLLDSYAKNAIIAAEWQNAEKRAKELIDLTKEIAPEKTADAKLTLAKTYELQNKLREAAREVAEVLGSKPQEKDRAKAYVAYSSVRQKANNLTSAKNLGTRGLGLVRKFEDDDLLVESLTTLGVTETLSGDFANAKEHLEDSLGKLESKPAGPQLARVYNNLGYLFQVQKDFDTAANFYEEAKRLGNECGAVRVVSHAAGNIAALCTEFGDVERLKENLEISMNAAQKVNDPKTLASAHSMHGYVLMQDGDLEGGKYYLNKAVKLGKEVGDDIFLGELYEGWGDLLANTNQKPEANAAYSEAKRLYSGRKNEQKALVIAHKSEKLKEK